MKREKGEIHPQKAEVYLGPARESVKFRGGVPRTEVFSGHLEGGGMGKGDVA